MFNQYEPKTSFLRVATATPTVAIGDVPANLKTIQTLYAAAISQQISLVVFPELCITGYSLGDTVRQRALLRKAQAALLTLAESTRGTNTAMIVGLPFLHANRLYNCAAFIADGEIKGLVVKSNMPNYNELPYEL